MNKHFSNIVCAQKGCVLFDLDGTLLDTAPDILAAANALFTRYNRSAFALEDLRHLMGEGTAVFLEKGLGYLPQKEEFLKLRDELFGHYRDREHQHSVLFPHIEQILTMLNEKKIPWGIVTNKLSEFTTSILDKFPILKTSQVLVCADTLEKCKPHPEPLWHACEILKRAPEHSVFVGDHERDVLAGKAAGLFVIVAMYGYIRCSKEALTWPADMFLDDTNSLLAWFNK